MIPSENHLFGPKQNQQNLEKINDNLKIYVLVGAL